MNFQFSVPMYQIHKKLIAVWFVPIDSKLPFKFIPFWKFDFVRYSSASSCLHWLSSVTKIYWFCRKNSDNSRFSCSNDILMMKVNSRVQWEKCVWYFSNFYTVEVQCSSSGRQRKKGAATGKEGERGIFGWHLFVQKIRIGLWIIDLFFSLLNRDIPQLSILLSVFLGCFLSLLLEPTVTRCQKSRRIEE